MSYKNLCLNHDKLTLRVHAHAKYGLLLWVLNWLISDEKQTCACKTLCPQHMLAPKDVIFCRGQITQKPEEQELYSLVTTHGVNEQ